MAGKERSGFDASEASLFYNASYILVPGEAPQSATDTLVSLAKHAACTTSNTARSKSTTV